MFKNFFLKTGTHTHGITEIVLWEISGAAFGACLGQEVGPWDMLIGAVVLGTNGSICSANNIDPW